MLYRLVAAVGIAVPVPCGQAAVPGYHGYPAACVIIARQVIRRDSLHSVRELTNVIGAFVEACNDHCQPFTRTKDGDQLLAIITPDGQTTNGRTLAIRFQFLLRVGRARDEVRRRILLNILRQVVKKVLG
jgi:hypothetical protein